MVSLSVLRDNKRKHDAEFCQSYVVHLTQEELNAINAEYKVLSRERYSKAKVKAFRPDLMMPYSPPEPMVEWDTIYGMLIVINSTGGGVVE